IRVGLTFAGVLARSLGKKAVGVSWLEAAAWKVQGPSPLAAVVVPGWKGESFFQIFRWEKIGPVAVHPPRWSKPEGLETAMRADLGGAEAQIVDKPELDASDLLVPARARLAAGTVEELAPLYIKPPHYEK